MAKKSFMAKIPKMLNYLKSQELLILLLVLIILFLVRKICVGSEGFTDDELTNEVKDGKKLVLFYADWCGYCKKIKPLWDKTAEERSTMGKKDMIKVDVGGKTPEQTQLMKKYNVSGFPTIIMFEDGKVKGVMSERTKEAFLSYLDN
jgi:thiol:disulfide interchange protein